MHRITSVNFAKIVLGLALKIKYQIGNSDAFKLTFRIDTPFKIIRRNFKKMLLDFQNIIRMGTIVHKNYH